MKTKIFNSYDEFFDNKRKNSDINGVSKEFAEQYPNYKELNMNNKGCWNCLDCTFFINCIRCEDSTASTYCSDCINCVHCYGSAACIDCINCTYCNNCQGCKGCEQVTSKVDVDDMNIEVNNMISRHLTSKDQIRKLSQNYLNKKEI